MPVSIQEIIHDYHRAQRVRDKEREEDRRVERNQGVRDLIARLSDESQ